MSPLESTKRLAVLGGEQPGEIVVLGLHQFQELEHHPGAALRVGRGPGRLGRGRVGDRLLDLGLAGKGDLGLNLAGVRVEHVAGPPGRSFDLFAADEVADVAHSLPPVRLPALRTLFHPVFGTPGGKPLVNPSDTACPASREARHAETTQRAQKERMWGRLVTDR